MKTITVNLPDSLVAWLEAQVLAGVFATFDEALAAAASKSVNSFDAPLKTKSGTIQAVDLTRQNFDSAAFVAGLVDKIHVKKMTQTPPAGS